MTPNFEQVIQSIQKLPLPEQEKIRQWLEEKSKSNGAENWQAKAEHSAKSLGWLNENRQKFLGQ